ncbi:MAG: hypothetical protein WC615_17740 [Mucilaginibacter sp.]|jgi:hypothetical protein|uniref:hypothetical protein n=1 Tax=Mucilaginibacter sp. TaxID=1882438 RepID=UPI003566DF7E
MSYTHPNYIKASNITLASILIGAVAIFFNHNKLISTHNIGAAIFMLIMLLLLAFLIRMGYAWMKYFLLVITLLGTLAVLKHVPDLINNTLAGIVEIIQTLLQIWIVILLFQVPKQTITDNRSESQ